MCPVSLVNWLPSFVLPSSYGMCPVSLVNWLPSCVLPSSYGMCPVSLVNWLPSFVLPSSYGMCPVSFGELATEFRTALILRDVPCVIRWTGSRVSYCPHLQGQAAHEESPSNCWTRRWKALRYEEKHLTEFHIQSTEEGSWGSCRNTLKTATAVSDEPGYFRQ
jgi:hypothetical protein